MGSGVEFETFRVLDGHFLGRFGLACALAGRHRPTHPAQRVQVDDRVRTLRLD